MKFGRPVSFDTGFAIRSNCSGICIGDDLTEKIYFADPTTKKELKIFSLDGDLELTIELDSAINELGEAYGISVIDPDSILINAPFEGSVGCVDRNGRLKHVYKPDLTYYADTNIRVESGASAKGAFIFGNCWLFRSDWAFVDMYQRRQENNMVQADFLEEYYHKRRRFPVMLRYYASANLPDQLKLGPDSFYIDLLGTESVYDVFDLFNHCHTTRGEFFFSLYSSKLFEINLDDLHLKEVAQVSSNNTDVGVPPCTARESGMDPECYIQKIAEHGYIDNIGYDQASNQYCVFVVHKSEVDVPYYERPFSIVVLDSNKQQVMEYVMDPTKYVAGMFLSTRNGLMIEQRNGDPKRSKTHTFVHVHP